MSDSSRIRVSIVAESSYGVTPATPTMLVLPVTGASLKDRIGYTQSNIINSSRDVQDLVRISKFAGGTIPCELMYSPAGEALDTAIKSVLCSTFTASATVSGCDYVGASNSITRASGDFVADGFAVGDIVKVTAYAGSTSTLYRRLATVAALTLTFEGDALGESDDASITVKRDARIKNSTTTPSFTIEVAYLDLQIAHIFTGCVFASADINLAIGQLATIVFGIEAQGSTRQSSAVSTDVFITGATYSAFTSHPTLDPISVIEIQGGGVDYAASSIATSWNNNVRPREQLGQLGAVSMARGQFAVTGRASTYFSDFGDHDDYAGNVASDLWFVLNDENGRGYALSYPQTKLSDVENPVTSNNSDVFKAVAMTAYKDPTELCTVRLHRID
jgi:hypothetical protein